MHQVCVVLQVCQVRRELLEQPAVAPGEGVGVAVTDPCADAIDGVVSAVEVPWCTTPLRAESLP